MTVIENGTVMVKELMVLEEDSIDVCSSSDLKHDGAIVNIRLQLHASQ